MNGLTLVFYPKDSIERTDIVNAIIVYYPDVQISQSFPACREQIMIKIKDVKQHEQKSIQDFLHFVFTKEQFASFLLCPGDLCSMPGCFFPTNEVTYALEFPIHDRYGEQPHRALETCAYHTRKQERLMLRTLEVLVLDPGRHRESNVYTNLWDKIGMWQTKQKTWYSQRVQEVDEGYYEIGHFFCWYSTPRLGPFTTKEAAIEAAKEHE